MEKPESWNIMGLYYALTLAVSVGLIIVLSKILHIEDTIWALISAVVCTELDVNQARQIISGRIFATVIGVIISSLVLILLGPGYVTVLVGVFLITLICHYFIHMGNSWKLAGATGILVLVAGLEQHSLGFAESIAIKRALEVIAGSLIAGIVSFTLGKLLMLYRKPLNF